MKHPLGALLRHLAPMPYAEKVRRRAPLYASTIHHGQEGSDLLGQRLAIDSPAMIARLGGTELRCVAYFLKVRSRARRPYPAALREAMSCNAGFFPATDEALDRFALTMLDHLRAADGMGICFNRYEAGICNRQCPGATLMEFGCLEPYRYQPPWSVNLRGRTVLVIHPFAESIARQYQERRRRLFQDPDVLPEFELKTMRPVQSSGHATVEFVDWFAAYDDMCRRISRLAFDIALIGAGAYGLPLAAFVKQQGKQAVQLGGVTQILFGIKGRRWETVYGDTTAKLFNQHWVRPSAAERPAGYRQVEGGAYW